MGHRHEALLCWRSTESRCPCDCLRIMQRPQLPQVQPHSLPVDRISHFHKVSSAASSHFTSTSSIPLRSTIRSRAGRHSRFNRSGDVSHDIPQSFEWASSTFIVRCIVETDLSGSVTYFSKNRDKPCHMNPRFRSDINIVVR